MLQARQCETPYSYIQSCKLVKANGEALRALQELDNAIKWAATNNMVIDLTDEVQTVSEAQLERRMKAKVCCRVLIIMGVPLQLTTVRPCCCVRDG